MFLQGHHCFKCRNNYPLNKEEFINKSIKKHGNLYDYSLSNYKNTHTKIKIICKKHGIFEQKPHRHYNGDGCPICNFSKGELKTKEILEKFNIKFKPQFKFNECKYIKSLPFDFYIPELKTCIEYHGIQHYEPVENFGGNESYIKQKEKDKIKRKYCKNNEIELIEISYKNFDRIENILEKRLKMQKTDKKY